MDTKVIRKTVKEVILRRGPITFRSVPVQELFAFIRKNALLGTDEISGDGKSWIRVDHHSQLRKFFSEDSGIKVLESEPDLSVEHENITSPAHIENKFQEVADLLRDIND